jgi:hypothetical protein
MIATLDNPRDVFLRLSPKLRKALGTFASTTYRCRQPGKEFLGRAQPGNRGGIPATLDASDLVVTGERRAELNLQAIADLIIAGIQARPESAKREHGRDVTIRRSRATPKIKRQKIRTDPLRTSKLMHMSQPEDGPGRKWVSARVHEWYRERRSWELSEEIRADVVELGAMVEIRQHDPGSTESTQAMIKAALTELDKANEVLYYGVHQRAPMQSHADAAVTHINAARLLYVRSFEPDPSAMDPYLPSAKEVVRTHLSRDDERRRQLEQISSLQNKGDLLKLVEAVKAANAVALRERLRAGSFARIVWSVAVLLLVLAVVVGALTSIWPEAVPLCFTSIVSLTASDEIQRQAICPIRSIDVINDQNRSRAATPADYWVVMVTGFGAALIAAAFALRNIKGTATPHKLYLALAFLKLPAGALTALGGLLLMSAGFVPGLTALDSSAQIIGWAVIFGYSQELFTHLVDKQGKFVLESVRGPSSPKSPPDLPPGPPDSKQEKSDAKSS